MSRRTKLIIVVIFLVLLAIPVAHVAFTWRTPNPLRFHIVAYHPPGSPEAWPEYGRLDLRVENTSQLPVHLFSPGFGRTDLSPGSTQLRFIISPTATTTLPLIPPRSSAPCACRVILGQETSPVAWEHEELLYTWESDTLLKWSEICLWLRDRAPECLHEFIESPQYFTDTTELSPAKP